MADIVNLKRFRKRKDRADKEAQAAENRVKFGRTKAEKQSESRNAAREDSKHAGKKREEKTED